MINISIKNFSTDRNKDIKKLVMDVHKEFGFTYDQKLDYDLDDIKKEYIQSGGGFWIAIHKEEVVGCVAIKEIEQIGEKIAELKRMYLYPNFRGKGIGQKMFEVALLSAKSKGYKKIILDTTINQIQAIKFYEKNGFVLIKQGGSVLYYSKKL